MKIRISETQLGRLQEHQKDWDELYEESKHGVLDIRIRRNLKKIFSDPEVRVKVGDYFYWTDGSNGSINMSNFNEFITDIGRKSYADDPTLLKDVERMKEHILYSYAHNKDTRAGERYRDFEYQPKSFEW
jgi:hypothetical protein